jgi:galactose mutarotase-like enzyme
VVKIGNKNGSIEVLPKAGLSLISFLWKGRDLIDQWDINTFIGTEKDIEFVASNTTDSFRKGFAPSIGPWFGHREKNGKEWQHGLCRYADWKDLHITENSITGRLDGSKDKILGRPINDICGYRFGVEISFILTLKGLEYRIKNLSEGDKGTFGIHWYWKCPKDTKIKLKTPSSKLPADIDKSLFTIIDDGIIADMNGLPDNRFVSSDIGITIKKGELILADGTTVEFYYDDIFKYTVIFKTKESCCFEPVSDVPSKLGTFKEGVYKFIPKVAK